MINEKMYNKSVELGICSEWSEKIKNASPEMMAKMYFLGSDWSFENNFPPLELLKENRELEKHGLMFSNVIQEFKNVDNLAFFGNSRAKIVYDKYNVAEIYIRHNAEIKIYASNRAIISVYLEDNAKVHIVNDTTAKVSILRYNKNALVSGEGYKLKEGSYGQ